MEPRTVLSRLIEQARRQGARGCEALYEQRDELRMTWERGSVGPPSQQQVLGIRLGVYLPEGREAWETIEASTSEALLDAAEATLDRALQRAALAPPDPHAGPVDRYDISERGLSLLDRRQINLGIEDRREVLEDNATGCKQVHPDIRVERIGYRELLTARSYASSRGHSATEHASTFEAIIRARMGRNGRTHHQRVASRQFANVASMPFGIELGQGMVQLTVGATLPQGELPLVVSATAVAHLLRSLAPAFVAPAVQGGASFIAGCFGQRIASPRLHLIDDPALPGALESRAFDDRGVPPAPVVLLREGVASGLYLDPRSARVADLRPTGHVMAGVLRPSNLVVRPGNRSRNAIGMDLNDYLVLESFHADQPIDLATGQIRSLCDVLVYRDHGYQGAVQGVPIDIPVHRFLGAIVEIASDQARYEEVDTCSMVLEGIALQA
jgi:predicted Zn-dependent protease